MNLREWKGQWATEPTQALELWMLNITPTDNPSINEAFNVGNDVGIDVTERELMNVNPSVDFNYGAEGKDIIGTVQDLTGKVGFRINGWVASAVVVGIASMAGYKYAKR